MTTDILSSEEKETEFQPRGSKDFQDGEWQYHCEVEGTIEKLGVGLFFLTYSIA